MVCVGNALVGDDAVGCAVHERLSGSQLPEGLRLELVGVGGLKLLDELQGEDALIAVDAVMLGAPPGTVHVVPWTDLPVPRGAVTSHGVGLREAMEIGRRLFPERMPGRAVLVGVEARSFDKVGEGMTPTVASAIAPAAEQVLDLARRLAL